jgi:hypothetical protein
LENRDCPSSLAFSTFLGGSANDGLGGTALAVDASGNTYVAGHTNSTDFPTTAGSFQASYNGGGASNGFVAKFDPSGGRVWATYLGGSEGTTDITALAIDASGNVYVTGNTTSANFPTTPGTLEPTFPGTQAAFVTELKASGSALVYSTYLGGGSPGNTGRAITVDSAGNAYVAVGTTSPADVTTPGAFQPTYPGGSVETYLAKLNPGGTALIYATYLGGSTFDSPSGIALDASGNVYVDGDTRSTNFPTTPGAFQTSYPGGSLSGYAAKLNATGTGLIYATYLGGSGFDQLTGIAADSAGNGYVTGQTNSTDFPTANPLQATLKGSYNAFVTKLNPSGTALVYSTYLGGSGNDVGNAIAVDSFGEAYVSGNTSSTDFPTANPVQASNAGGGNDAFVSKLDASGTTLLFSSDLGGSSNEFGQAIAVDAAGNIYVAGSTSSTDFPTTPGAFQGSYGGGGSDAFLAKITPTLPPAQAIGLVNSQVDGLSSLNDGEKNSLESKLQAAQQSLTQGNNNAAVNQLNAFSHEIRALKRSKRLDAATADFLIGEIQTVIDLLR